MGQWDIYNEVLLLLYEKSSKFIGINDDYDAVCQQLQVDNLILSVTREDPGLWAPSPAPSKYILYAIHPNGIKLIAALPAEYNGKPYDYFLKLKQDALDAEANFKDLINKVNKATIRTSMWTKLMFIATLVIAAGTLALAIYPLIQRSDASKAIQQIQYRLQQIDNRTLPQTQTMPPAPTVIPRTRLKDSLERTSAGK